MAFRFLHAADLHLDTPFVGLGVVDPELAEELRTASLRAWRALIDEALRRDVDFVVLAGDIYDGAQRGLRAQLALRDGLQRLSDAGVRVFMVRGNHDPVDEGWSAVSSWPERVTEFGQTPETTRFLASDGTAVSVCGVSYGTRHESRNLAATFPNADADGFSVAVLHANVGGDGAHDPYAPCELSDLAKTGHRYWALGHIHTRAVLSTDPCVVYPGNVQGRSFRETGPRGAMLVEVQDGVASPTFVALDVVRFARVSVDVSACPDVGDALDALVAAAAEVPALGRALIVRGELVGQSSLAEALRREDLLSALGDRLPGITWDRVTVSVRGELDLDEARTLDDLRGTLVATHDALMGTPDVLRGDAAALFNGSLRQLLGTLDDTDLAAVWQEAARDALSRLAVEETP